MKKINKAPIKTPRTLPEKDLSRSLKSSELSEKKLKKSVDDETGKVKTLKAEMKTLDLQYSIMLQWAYANYILDFSAGIQEESAVNQIYDRGKQIIELKKTVSSLELETSARSKNKLLDDVLSMEYSSLKSLEEDILVSTTYLKELEENSYNLLNRLDLAPGVIISPQDLSGKLEKNAYTLRKLATLIEDEVEDIKTLSEDFLEIVNITSEQETYLSEIKKLQQEFLDLKSQERIQVIEQTIESREKVLKSILLNDSLI